MQLVQSCTHNLKTHLHSHPCKDFKKGVSVSGTLQGLVLCKVEGFFSCLKKIVGL